VPSRTLDEIELKLDELEALRLADLEGLYHEEAAGRMGISRPTFGRLIETARRKVATALLNAKALTFKGGCIAMQNTRTFECTDCQTQFEVPFGTGSRPDECPGCHSKNVCRAGDERGGGRGRCRHRGRGQGRGGRRGQGAGAGRAPAEVASTGPQTEEPS